MSPGSICKLVSPAGGAEQFMQAGDLLRIADIELVQHAADAGLFQDLAPDAAAGKQLLRQLHRMGLLGLQHKAAGIKVFGKAGNAIGSRTHTAFLLGLRCAISSRALDAKLIVFPLFSAHGIPVLHPGS